MEVPRKNDKVPFVAVNLDGNLQVTVFEDGRDAREMYNSIRDEYTSSPSFEESDDGRQFSVDESEGPSVMVGKANYVKKNTKWRIK